MPQMNGSGPEQNGSLMGRGLGKCREVSQNELLEKLGKGIGLRRKSGGGQGNGKRLKSGIININK